MSALSNGSKVVQQDGAGVSLDWVAPRPINETKALMIAVMGEFDRPMTSAELYGIWDGTKSLKAIEYHLSTLAMAKVVEVVFGPELHFQLVPVIGDVEHLSGSSAVSAYGIQAH